MNNGNTPQDIHDLFGDAQAEGFDSSASMILVDNLDAVALAGANGASLDEINTDDVTLAAFVLDASGSMSGVRRDVIDGFNLMLETFNGSKGADSILVSAWSFNDAPVLHYSYTPAPLVAPMTLKEYTPDGSTALYDTLLHVMTGMVAYGQTLRNNGVRTRCVIVAMSDGDDNVSRANAHQVKTVSESLLAQEIYTLAYAGFGSNNLQQIANAVGFPSIITAGSSPSEIRRIFKQVSTSLIRQSQSSIGAGNGFFVI